MEETTALAAAAARRHIINRPRLTRLLDETEARIILLVAPAGYGKTTLAREWLSASPQALQHACTTADQDVAVLATALIDEFRRVGIETGTSVSHHLRAGDRGMLQGRDVADRLIEDLATSASAETTLLLDDYHVLVPSSESEAFVARLAENAPLRLVLGSRERPPWVTARSVLYGEVREIGRAVLSMSEDEASQVLGTTDLVGIVALADGWPAVIGLAARINGQALTRERVPAELYDFFAQELFHATPGDLQRDLALLARLPRITLASSEAIFGKRARSVMEAASARGYFTSVTRDAFEIHPLLREFLIDQRPTLDEKEHRALCRFAEMLITSGEWDNAFTLTQALDSPKLFLMLLETALTDLLAHSRAETLRRWLYWAREQHLSAPVLDAADAEIAFRTGDLRRAELLAASSAPRLDNHKLRSRVFFRAGQAAYLIDIPSKARQHFSRAAESAQDNADLQLATWGSFLVLTEHDAEEAERTLGQFEAASDGTPPALLRLYTGKLALASRIGGLHDALDAARSAHALIEDVDDPVIVSGFLHMHGCCLSLMARYDESAEISKLASEYTARERLEFVEPHAQLLRALTCIGQRRFNEAERLLSRVATRSNEIGDIHLRLTAATARLQLRASEGALDRALREAPTFSGSAARSRLFSEYAASRALIHAGVGQSDEASHWLLRSEAAGQQLEGRMLGLWTKAVLELREPEKLGASAQAMAATTATGNYNTLVVAYRTAPSLLQALMQLGHEDEVGTIVAQARDENIAGSVGFKSFKRRGERSLDLLTRREKEIHVLLTRGLSNREIARALFIQEVTVKVHLRHIYEKLGVRSRTQAALYKPH